MIDIMTNNTKKLTSLELNLDRDNIDKVLKSDWNEEKFKMAMVVGKMGVWEWNVATGQAEWSKELSLIHGLQTEKLSGPLEGFWKNLHPEDKEHIDLAMASIQNGSRGY